jgi:hypothetical protein
MSSMFVRTIEGRAFIRKMVVGNREGRHDYGHILLDALDRID